MLSKIFLSERNNISLPHVRGLDALRLQLPLDFLDCDLPCQGGDDSAGLWLYDLNSLNHVFSLSLASVVGVSAGECDLRHSPARSFSAPSLSDHSDQLKLNRRASFVWCLFARVVATRWTQRRVASVLPKAGAGPPGVPQNRSTSIAQCSLANFAKKTQKLDEAELFCLFRRVMKCALPVRKTEYVTLAAYWKGIAIARWKCRRQTSSYDLQYTTHR
jgi:hypothetical protein